MEYSEAPSKYVGVDNYVKTNRDKDFHKIWDMKSHKDKIVSKEEFHKTFEPEITERYIKKSRKNWKNL